MVKTRGSALIIAVVAMGLIGLATWIFRPAFTHGESRRAAESTKTTAQLESAYNKAGAVAAASVNQISQVASTLADSREKTFLTQESSVAASSLPPPDPIALWASERRKNAVLEGQVQLSQKLYSDSLKNSDKLNHDLEEAKADKRAIDLELETVASAHLAATRQRNILIAVVVVLFVLFAYARITRIGPGAMGEAVADIKAGIHPIQALDGVTSRFQQKIISFIAKIKSK